MNDEQAIPKVGAVLKGRVVCFLPHGALLRIGPKLTGLLHGSQASWLNKKCKVDELLKVGDEVDVAVMEVKCSKKSKAVFISLSRLPTQQNPWLTINAEHPVGSRVKAKVVDFLPFGATVEFESGFRALVHDSEMSWTERDPKANQTLSLGQEIDVVIEMIDEERRRIHASYRKTIENPWTTFLNRFPIGSTAAGRVASVREFGVFVILSNGCIGLLHQSSLPTPLESFAPGDAVNVVIQEFVAEKNRIAFGYSSGDGGGA